MGDQDQQQSQQVQQAQTGDTSAATINTVSQPGPVPYERFQEVNAQLKELKQFKTDWEKQQAEGKRASEEAEKKRLAEQGQFKELADQAAKKASDLEPFKAKAERYEGALGKLLAEERKGLPKHVTALLDRLDPAEQLEWIAENRAELGKPAPTPPPNVNAKDGGAGAAALDDAQKRELAAIYGVKPQYLK